VIIQYHKVLFGWSEKVYTIDRKRQTDGRNPATILNLFFHAFTVTFVTEIEHLHVRAQPLTPLVVDGNTYT